MLSSQVTAGALYALTVTFLPGCPCLLPLVPSRDVLAYPLTDTGVTLGDTLRALGSSSSQVTWGAIAGAVLSTHSSLPATVGMRPGSPYAPPHPATITTRVPCVGHPVREVLLLGGGGTRLLVLDVHGTATVYDAPTTTALFTFLVVAPASNGVARGLEDVPRDVIILSRPADVDPMEGDCVIVNLTHVAQGLHVRDCWQFGLAAVLPCRLTPSQEEGCATPTNPVRRGPFLADAVLALTKRHLVVCWEHGGARVVVFDWLSGAALACLQQSYPGAGPLPPLRASAPCAPALHVHGGGGSGMVVGVWGRQSQGGAATGTTVTLWDLDPVQWVGAAIRADAEGSR